MGMIAFIGPLVAAAASAQVPIHPSPVQIVGEPQEKMARKLDAAVRKKFGSDPRFVLTNNATPAALTIAMPERVGWERRLEWTEIHFQARISRAGRTQIVAGYCYNWNLSECAKLLTNAAASFVAE